MTHQEGRLCHGCRRKGVRMIIHRGADDSIIAWLCKGCCEDILPKLRLKQWGRLRVEEPKKCR